MVYHAPPGPPIFTVRYTVNFMKGTMMFYLFALMIYFDNFSLGAWTYLALHGSYGFLWLAKDLVFPDPLTQAKMPVVSWLILVVPVLLPYQMIGFWMMSGTENRNPSYERVFVAYTMYVFGVVMMMVTDA